MSIFELLFGFQGRISRAQWWLGQLTALALGAIFYAIWSGWVANYGLTKDMLQSASPATQIRLLSYMVMVGMIISSTMVWMLFSLAIKRVHDRDHSGWWVLALGLPFLFLLILPNTAMQVVAGLTATWYFLELGTLGGSPHVNTYGPPISIETDGDVTDPRSRLSAEDILAHKLAAGRNRRQTGSLSDDDLEVGNWPSGNRAATFGRRASA